MVDNKSDKKLFGGILLVIGTAIGGGMLALPMATANAGFMHSLLLLVLSWFIMTASALVILEINLWLPANTNIISMAKTILGRGGELVAWISYLLLFYSLLAAYLAGGGDCLHMIILHELGWQWPNMYCVILFLGCLGSIVYCGIQYIDYFNRILMIAKLGIYLLLVLAIAPFISIDKLIRGDIGSFTTGITIVTTSFTFAYIVPSLRTYFKSDIAQLRKAILIGSAIPLVCYIVWNMSIMGIIPRHGEHGLLNLAHTHRSNEFINQLSNLLDNRFIALLARSFTATCLTTSFLAAALSLSDFLADGLGVAKKGKGNIIVYTAAFLPPLVIVSFYPQAFLHALNYAGIFCLLLFVLLPALMAWRGRYSKHLSTFNPGLSKLRLNSKGYQIPGGKPLLGLLFCAASVAILCGCYELLSS